MSTLYDEIRKMDNLQRAWRKVRANVLCSENKEFVDLIKQHEQNLVSYLRGVQDQLRTNKFVFLPQKGYFKKKYGGGKRPIVVSPISNRLVQRAILEVFQTKSEKTRKKLGSIPDVLETPTSVGGSSGKGVHYGIQKVSEAIKDGNTFFLRSDIREFFTKIPKKEVGSFVRKETNDGFFSEFFLTALSTEIENENEVKEAINLFPIGDSGVPQGSSLSVFAGNVILRDFDKKLNSKEITTLRYIDDFIILGLTEEKVLEAFETAKTLLNKHGMTAYGPLENPQKSKSGLCEAGFDFLGWIIKPGALQPTKKSKQNLLTKVKKTLKKGRENINLFLETNNQRRIQETFAQTLAKVDNTIRGWGDAYNYCNDTINFHHLDKKLDEMINEFIGWTLRHSKKATPFQRRRVLGITLLGDIPLKKIEEYHPKKRPDEK